MSLGIGHLSISLSNGNVPAPGNGLLNQYSILLDGVNEEVTISDPGLGTGPFTLSVWVKTTTTSQEYAFGKAGTNVVAIGVRNAGKATMLMGGAFIDSTLTYNNDVWHHFAGTRGDGGATVTRFYVDGAEVGNGTSNTNVNGGSWLIGRARGSGYYWPGNIDEPTIWDAALTSGEITELYHSGVPMDPTMHSKSGNLLHWWRCGDDPFDDMTGGTGTLRDQVGSNNGTPVNTEAGDKVADVP